MVEHTMLVSVEDAVSISWKRADGLAELFRGMFDPGSDEVDSWNIIKDALFAIRTDLIKAEGTLDELHKASWARVDKSYGAFCEAMERRNDQDASDKAEPALLKGPACAAFAGALFGANDRPPLSLTSLPGERPVGGLRKFGYRRQLIDYLHGFH